MGRLVEETLRRLSERHRVALVLKDLHGFTHEEIAAVLGISRGAAETLLFRARESFRSVFEALSPDSNARDGCVYARSVALALVGRDVSPLQKRELVAHAKDCPACRRSLRLRGGLAVGLGLFVRELAPPAAMGPSAAMAAVAPPATAALGGAGSAGVLAKVAALFAGKAAVVAVAAAGATTLAGGTVAYTQLHGHHGPHRRDAPAATPARGQSRGPTALPDRAAAKEAGPRGSHGRSLAAHDKAGKARKAKTAQGAANKKTARGRGNDANDAKATGSALRRTAGNRANGTATGRRTTATGRGH